MTFGRFAEPLESIVMHERKACGYSEKFIDTSASACVFVHDWNGWIAPKFKQITRNWVTDWTRSGRLCTSLRSISQIRWNETRNKHVWILNCSPFAPETAREEEEEQNVDDQIGFRNSS